MVNKMAGFKFLNQYDVNVHQFYPKREHDLKIRLILLSAIGVPIKKAFEKIVRLFLIV
ncbi:hypothetical protein GCM10023206_31020 [Acinetobacter puyangensis]